MNFKKPKDQVISEAESAACNSLSSSFSNIKYGIINQPIPSVLDSLQYAMARAISDGIRSIVENTYTDQEFEEDLKLRDKL